MCFCFEFSNADTAHLARAKAHADAELYRAEHEAAANEKLLTPEYLEALRSQALSTNAKLYFGPSIPQLFVDNSAPASASSATGGAAGDASASTRARFGALPTLNLQHHAGDAKPAPAAAQSQSPSSKS